MEPNICISVQKTEKLKVCATITKSEFNQYFNYNFLFRCNILKICHFRRLEIHHSIKQIKITTINVIVFVQLFYIDLKLIKKVLSSSLS